MKTAKVLSLLLIVLSLGGAGWFLFFSQSDRPEETRNLVDPAAEGAHQEAMKRWPELVRNGFKGESKEIERVFFTCFRKGDLAEGYESLFATARDKIQAPGHDEASYFWGQGSEGDIYFCVEVEGSPAIITSVHTSEYVR